MLLRNIEESKAFATSRQTLKQIAGSQPIHSNPIQFLDFSIQKLKNQQNVY